MKKQKIKYFDPTGGGKSWFNTLLGHADPQTVLREKEGEKISRIVEVPKLK